MCFFCNSCFQLSRTITVILGKRKMENSRQNLSTQKCWCILSFVRCFRNGKFVFPARKIFFPIKFACLKNRPRISSPYETVHFSSTFSKFCGLGWALRALQLACAWKIFSAHYIISSLALLTKMAVSMVPAMTKLKSVPST